MKASYFAWYIGASITLWLSDWAGSIELWEIWESLTHAGSPLMDDQRFSESQSRRSSIPGQCLHREIFLDVRVLR